MASRMSKRFTGFLSRSKSTTQPDSSTEDSYVFDNASANSSEGDIIRNIRLFCESGSTTNGGDEEVLYLPAIVDTAESSPSAAAAAARQINIFLNREWAVKPHVQYNAIMLIRILSDNPGPSFSKNFDKAFVSTIKEALRKCHDRSTQQMLRETLDTLEANKPMQEGMEGLLAMWRKEKGQNASFGNPGSNYALPRGAPNDFVYRHPTTAIDQRPGPGGRSYSSRHHLPPPVELASRIEEAKNTAKILLQLIQSTPSEELLYNELIREFSDRCQSAQKSMAGYIACDNPPPDDETMLTLIETNEQLSLAASRYQRSLLNARKALGVSPSPNAEAMQNSAPPADKPLAVPPSQEQSLFGSSGPRSTAKSPPPPPAPPGLDASAFGNSNPNESFQAPYSPPLWRTSQPRVVPNNSEAFSAPSSPPSRQPTQPIAYADRNGSYSPPPSPPTAMLARLNSREGQTSANRLGSNQISDPFADPVEHSRNPAPLAIESTQLNSAAAQHPTNIPYSNTFNVDSGPTYAPGSIQATPTDDDQYDASPVQTRAAPIFDAPVSPVSPSRTSAASPSQQRWQDLRAASYMGRQNSAAEGLTMRGAQADPSVAEIDGYSNVGRTLQPTGIRSNTEESDGASSAYSVEPSQTRT